MSCENYSKDDSARVSIIGWGCAGVNVAIGLREAGYEGQIDVFSDSGSLPYSPILTSYFVGGEKTDSQCHPWEADELASLNLCIHEEKVSRLDAENHMIYTQDGNAYPYSKCAICTGSRPLSNGFPKNCGYSPLMLRTMKDAYAMKEAFESEQCKRVLISGASMVALKILEAAMRHGLDADLVGVNPQILDFNSLPEVARRFERGLQDRGVDLILGDRIDALEVIDSPSSYKGRTLRVTFASGKIDEFDEICVAHGMACNLDFIEDGQIDLGPAVIVDDRMRSSDPDIYAAGDVAQALELVSGEKRIVGIWKSAVIQGQTAGRAIYDDLCPNEHEEPRPYQGFFSSNTIEVDGILFISGGTIELSGKRYAEVQDFEDMIIAQIFDPEISGIDGKPGLVGFNLSCDSDKAGGDAYDIGAILTLRMEKDLKRA